MPNPLCLNRLQQERKDWRKDHPFGFWAKPQKNPDGSLNLMKWNVGIPGKKDTKWEGAVFPVTLTFPEEYPSRPPACHFPAGFYHPNIYPSGKVCLSLVNEGESWKPAIRVKEIVLGIQELLDDPNPRSPAQEKAYHDFVRNKDLYNKKVKEQVKRYIS
ncbi:hypothetical protein CANCADRAFT_148214 [Tortispora caseinolytica NRRL Y-17796]|uniref:SUMO-conjugating enzyme UBC9 n=1 Tax=Tortispora caseinolytica NRRL Y-17796 TaxID=767744 RepID=A0A1E4THY4_9ASCO|nr:hypothetical protein CANCADRAFT_148214 [Tortispora caseinolytica NRRL Y-17796]